MDLQKATEAFTKFEGHRLAELLEKDVELEDAQRIVLEQWQAMDDLSQGAEGTPSGAPTPSRRRPGCPEGGAKRSRRDVWRCLEPLEESSDAEEGPSEAQRAFRRSSVVQGGKHPEWLTEPAAVAEISLPQLTEDDVVQLPREVVEKRLLSGPQLESVAYAARRFRSHLPSGVRAGYYLGDGTGCGKGRVIAALAWHLWNTGAKRHVWLSAASDLQVDAARDFRDLGVSLPFCKLSSVPYGPIGCTKGLDSQGNGIIFASYHLLVASKARSDASPETSRLQQLIHWLLADSKGGLICLDEAHRAKNVASAKASASKSGLAALELQRACPDCCVLYASATGASELRHLGYLERLGLWGQGRPHGSFEELMKAVEGGGLAAMELLAMTMRAEGMLSCRCLSFQGASFRLVPVALEKGLGETYEAACDFWQSSLQVAKSLLKERTKEVKRMRLKHCSELKENALHMRASASIPSLKASFSLDG